MARSPVARQDVTRGLPWSSDSAGHDGLMPNGAPTGRAEIVPAVPTPLTRTLRDPPSMKMEGSSGPIFMKGGAPNTAHEVFRDIAGRGARDGVSRTARVRTQVSPGRCPQ